MSDASYIVQKVEWFQLRTPQGQAIMVMVAGLPNGFYTAVPCEVTMRLAAHGLMALAASPEEALSAAAESARSYPRTLRRYPRSWFECRDPRAR